MKKNLKNQKKKKLDVKKIRIVGCIIILLIVSIIIVKNITNKNNKNYEIEEVKKFSYFKLYENKKYGVIDNKGNILIPANYEALDIPNPSKAVFIAYVNTNEKDTVVLNDKNEKILTNFSRSITNNV